MVANRYTTSFITPGEQPRKARPNATVVVDGVRVALDVAGDARTLEAGKFQATSREQFRAALQQLRATRRR